MMYPKFTFPKLFVFLLGILICSGMLSMAQDEPGRGRGRMGPGGPGFGGPGMLMEFDAIDANKDGNLSKEEIADWTWNRLAGRDTDNNQSLSRKELEPMGQPGRGPEGRGPEGRGPGGVDFSHEPLAKNDTEKKVMAVLEDVNANMRYLSVPPSDGRILRLLAESQGAKNIVEIGTSTGYSGLWLGLALLGTGGHLTTFEIDAERAATARENFKKAGFDSLITVIEGDAHEKVTELKEPIDFLFLDADKEGYIDYLNKLMPLIRPGGLIVAHNMTQRQADPKYVEAITANPNLETVFINLEGSGMGLTMKKR